MDFYAGNTFLLYNNEVGEAFCIGACGQIRMTITDHAFFAAIALDFCIFKIFHRSNMQMSNI